MAADKNKPKDHKSELIMELAERFSYWTSVGETEYAAAYQHLMYAFTAPTQPPKKDE